MAERATQLAQADDAEGLREALIDILEWCLGNAAALSASLSDLRMSFETPEGPTDQQVLGLLNALVQINLRSQAEEGPQPGAPVSTEASDSGQGSGGNGSV